MCYRSRSTVYAGRNQWQIQADVMESSTVNTMFSCFINYTEYYNNTYEINISIYLEESALRRARRMLSAFSLLDDVAIGRIQYHLPVSMKSH